MKNVILKKEKYLVTEIKRGVESKAIEKEIRNSIDHLCWTVCGNAYCSKCPKIADQVKKSIDNYDFISDGYQVYNKSGELVNFLVTGCDYCVVVNQGEKKRPFEELQRIREVKARLKTLYWGVGSVEEADKLKSELDSRSYVRKK